MNEELNIEHAFLDKFITHGVGNKMLAGELNLSSQLNQFSESSKSEIQNYFLSPFEYIDVHAFNTMHGLENKVYEIAGRLFDQQDDFIQESKNLAEAVYEAANHERIKSAHFSVAYFTQLSIEDEVMDAIGIFRSENELPFIKMNQQDAHYEVQHDLGYPLNGIDKGCLILQTEKSDGYRVLVKNKYARSAESQYWIYDFLKVLPIADEYNNTKELLQQTKSFVVSHLDKDMPKTDKLDILDRTMNYFNNNESFEKEGFQQQVLQSQNLITEFSEFEENKELSLNDAFDISPKAVSNQSRNFKSVLKLDKNFHIYIHGDKTLIERGTEFDGRKYYKIYYDKER